MNYLKIKDKLLSTNEFIDNEYLLQYCELISKNINIKSKSKSTHKHHILPRSYYKYNNLEVDNSDSNLVTLIFKDHILAHYLLYRCACSRIQVYANAHAVVHLINQKHLTIDNLTTMFNNIDLEECQRLYEAYHSGVRPIISQTCSGNLNGRCKVKDISICNKIKLLLNENMSYKDIEKITGVSTTIISNISSGKHWSCKEDGFVSDRVIKYRESIIHNQKLKEERAQKRAIRLKEKEQLEKLHIVEYENWLSEPHYCKVCGKLITRYFKSKHGNGEFCSKNCIHVFINQNRTEEEKKNILKNRRSYIGENNPNFGKKMSKASRQKLSMSLKNSMGVKNSSRFKGHQHSEEAKRKIGESSKKRHEKQKIN